MQIFTNENLIKRYALVSKVLSTTGILVLLSGLAASFLRPEWYSLPFYTLIAGFMLSNVAMLFYQTRYWDELDFYTRTGLTCVIPGAAGNLIDRVVYGDVTDFFHFRWYETSFFVNNIADCSISVVVVFFIIPLFINKKSSASSKSI